MKINELQENECINIVECYHYRTFTTTRPIKHLRVFNEILTDGNIAKIDEGIEKVIDGYSIGFNKYSVNRLQSNKVYLENFSYAIVYTIGEEWRRAGNWTGWFYIIKSVDIYLKDKKDRKALKEAKKAIRNISIMNSSVNYNSLFDRFKSRSLKDFEVIENSDFIYTLKRK